MARKCMSLCMMLLFVLILSVGYTTTAYAVNEDPTSFLTEGTSGKGNVGNTSSQLKVLGVSIHTLITTILNIVGLIVLAVYGGKWWLAGKDSTKKKELKEEGINYVIGSLIFFGAAFIYKLIHSLATNFTTASGTKG